MAIFLQQGANDSRGLADSTATLLYHCFIEIQNGLALWSWKAAVNLMLFTLNVVQKF